MGHKLPAIAERFFGGLQFSNKKSRPKAAFGVGMINSPFYRQVLAAKVSYRPVAQTSLRHSTQRAILKVTPNSHPVHKV
jgi:hypothetical protein